MKAILKPFFALCGLVALSTALSADSRLFPVGGGGAGWGEPGFLYSDYLQTAAASGREVEFQGSFVLDNRRPFLAELGTAFPGRVVDEVKSLPLREWGLGYVFEKRRPAHQRALLERGWRLADWLAEETLMAATESSRGGGLIRTLEFDLQSELGGRRAQVGLNVLGALRESNDEAIAWQFRGFKSSGGLGGNTGLIWRRAVANDRALAGANVFLDYETYADENFWRGSAGAELRSAWADVFGNVYRGFSDDVKKNNRTTYTADGYDVELNVHSPELPWLVGEVAYYNFEGKAGDKDDDGVRFGLRFNPLTDLELGVEYDNGDSDDDGKKKWAARIRYSGEFGGVLKAQYRPSTNSGNFEPRDWFFAPVEREYSQRIRKSTVTASIVPEFTFAAANLGNSLPIELEGAGLALVVSLDGTDVVVTGVVNGQAYTPRTLTAVVDANTGDSNYAFAVAQALTGTVTVKHMGSGTLTLNFPQTQSTVAIGSTVAIATQPDDFFRLINGEAEVMVGGGGGSVFIVEQYADDENIRRIMIPVVSSPTPIATLAVTVVDPGNNAVVPDTHLPPVLDLQDVQDMNVTVVPIIGGVTMAAVPVNSFQASVELANDPVLTDSSPPSYYKGAGAASSIIILGTLRASGGGGDPYTSSKVSGSGDLVINNGVVGIPTSQEPATGAGNTLVLQIRVNDNPNDAAGLGGQTAEQMVGFTVVYRQITPLAASLPSGIQPIYGVLGDSSRKDVTTAVVSGGPSAFSYSPIDGALRLDAGHVVYIPAGNPPAAGDASTGGNLLTLNSEVRQAAYAGVPAMTVTLGLTVRYIGIPAVSANLAPTTPAVSTGLNSFAITAEAGDTTEMDVLVISGRGGAGGTFTMRRTAGELSFVPNTGRVYFSSGTAPRSEAYTLVVEIDDSGTGQDATPTYTLTVRVQYDDVEVIRVNFNDPDGLVTVYGLQGQATAYANVAQVETGGGFGAITLAKEGGDLDLVGRQINIPAVLPTGQDLVITVSGNDSETNNPEITDAATAILTVEYAQVPTLNATFSRVNARNGQVGSALGEKVLTVGMTTTNPSEFTVAKVVAAGGVGSPYTYTKQSGNGQLDVNSDGEVLIAANTPPGDLSLTVVVQVDDSGDNSEVSPAFLASLTVFYNTIGVIAAEVVDTRNNAVPSVIKADGGTVYFLSAGNNVSTPFGRLEVNGGLGNQFSDYDIVASNESGITYNNRILSMEKCSSGTKSIRFTINDDSVDDGNTTEEIVFDVSLTNECVDAIATQLKDAANADATSPLQIYGLEGKTDATVVAAWTATGGGGDLTWSKTGGDLNLTSDNRVQVPQGTSPGDAPNGDALVLTAMVNDEDDKGGFLTAPVVTEMTVNYIEVPAVQLALNDDDDNAITSPVNVYGVESVAKAADKRKVANIAVSGGAGGALALSFQTSGDGATTADSFEIVGNNAVNITKAFPAFGASELATVAVVASDSGANSGATPDVTVRATVQILPVLAAVEAGGNIVGVGSPDNVLSPTSPSATEANFTVYALANAPHTIPIAQVSAAAVTRNAGVAGASGLRVQAPTRHSDSTPEASGLTFSGGNPVAQVRIADGATPTSGGADLKLVLEYEDEGFDAVADLTESRTKTVNVHYELVAPFIVNVRNADDSSIPAGENVTVYVAKDETAKRNVARLSQIGGADGMQIRAQNGELRLEQDGSGVFYVVVTADTEVGSTLHLTAFMNDAPATGATPEQTAQASLTPEVEVRLTVEYLETQDVVATFSDITGNNHFLGAADSTSGVRTLYFKDSETRPAQLDILRINAQSGTGQYTFKTTPAPFGLDGFALTGSGNNRMLALLAAKADSAMAVATVEIDDTGNADQAALSDPITLTASVAVKHVEAIEVELIVPEDVPGGATAGDTLGALYVRSAAAANSSSVHIANASASKGVEQFTYTRQSESSAELLLNDSGEVHLAANYTPDGNKTLSIIIAANDGDSVDGSTLTEAAMITLEFVLAETIGAVAFLRNNGGAYVPNGTSANDVAWGSGMRTVKVKTADYGNEQLVVGVRGSGGLGNSPAYSIAWATGGNENGLVTRTPSPDGYGLGVAVKDGAVASSAPQTFGITAVVNESGTDPNNLTPGATISVTVVYDKVDEIAGAFEDTDGDPIPGRHVVARSEGVSNTDLMVASLNVSGGVGKDTGGDYTFTQDTPGDLIVNADGKVLVKGGVVPAIGLNLEATVKINDTGNWAHVSDELEVEITVLYSSKVVLDATIVDTRDDAVPANIPRTGGSVYFLNDDPDENAVFARVDFSGALPGDDTYVVTASDEVGLSYDTSTRELSMTKCTDTPSATKSIKLTANDSPDTAGVSDPLVVEIEVTSGAAQCFDAISARPERLNAVRGAHITDIPKFYRLAGDDLDADLPVATVHVDGGAPAYVSGKTGGELNLVKGSQGELTVVIPNGTTAKASANNLKIVITVNDDPDSNKGGFLTEPVTVEMTVDFAEVQPHGNLQGVLADGVTGSLADGLLTVRRVAASSTPLRIVTNIRPAIPTEERLATEGSFTNFQIVFNTTTSQQDLQLIAGQEPDGAVRMITVKVENHKAINRSPDDDLQFAARPDKLFTIAVRYLGELEAAAYDSETETKIETSTGDINRYVESDEGAVAVATVSVSGGTSPYSYTLVAGGLELGTNLANMTVLIPASAVPSAAPGLKLTARIEINDTGRADTTPLNVDLTANYISIPGHSNLTLVRDGETTAEDLDGSVIYPLIRDAQNANPVAALSEVGFKTPLVGESLSRVDGDAALLFDATAKQVRVAGGTPLNGQTLTLKLRGSDGDGETSDSAAVRAQKAARSDRLYTVAVRYLEELTAKALEEEGGTEISGVREIKVPTGQTSKQAAAYIQIEGGTEGYQLQVVGSDSVFELDDRVLSIKDGTQPGALGDDGTGGGKLLTATVSVNDNESEVGGPQTDAVLVEVEFNYIALPEVVGSFVETRGDGTKNVPTSSPVTVFSFYTFPPQNLAPATVVATAKATVTGRDGDTFTYHRVGGADTFSVDENTGAITLKSRRPANGNVDQHLVTVEFRAAANAVATRQTLTVRHQMIRSIASGVNALSTPLSCYQNVPQPNPPNRGNQGGTQITVILPPGEEGTQYSPGGCSYFVNLPNRFVGIDPAPPGGNRIARTGQDASGLEVYSAGSDTRVRLVGTPPTFTAEDITLSVVVANTHTGPGGHVVPALLQTAYVVFPGVEKLEAALETPAGAAIDKPLTVYVAAADASAKLVATVKASGGEGDGYSYAGTRTGGHATALIVNTDGEIFIPAGFEPVESPGTEFRFEVAVDDTGGDARRRGATPQRKVILTVQYIKTSGPLMAEAVYATPDVYEASSTIFYGAKGVKLSNPLNVASITPSGGIPNPNYTFEIQEDSSNPAANSELEITGSGNERVVQLKGGESGATPSAATSEARRRMITVRVTDTGDVGNSIDPMTMDVVVSVNFVEVTAHADLVVENGGTSIGSDFVVVRPTTQSDAVAVADKVAVADASLSESTTEAADGLSFVSAGNGTLEIDSGANPPTGKTLSIVLIASDGTATPQEAARQDETYTVSVRYVPAIAAEVQDSSGARIAAVVELTVLQGVQPAVVGKIAASGGVTNSYTYAPTAVSGSENLQVDANGDIRIPTGVTPLPGDGRTITVEIAVDDATAADSGETDPANVQITVKYVLLEAPAIEAQNLAGNALDNTNTPTFYRLSGDDLDSDMPVAKVAGSKGSGDYTFAIVDAGGNGVANGLKLMGNDGTTLALASGETAAAAGSADRVVTVRLTDTDNRLTSGNTADVIVTVRFEEVAAHADVTFNPQSGITPNTDNEYRVVQAGAPGANVHVLNLVSSDTLSRTEGDAQLVFVAGSPPRLEILDSTPRDGRTLTVVISQTDNDDNEQEIARPDRTYTISVRYIPALAAEARNAADDAVLNAPIVITSKAGLRQVARIAVSGGTSDSYDFTIENLHPAGNDLIVGSSNGIVSIPAEVIPVVGGLALTVRITANDKTASKDNDATDPASALVTVIYHFLESPEIEARDKDGTAVLTDPNPLLFPPTANPAVFYRLADLALTTDLPVAKVVGSKGVEGEGYRFAIEGGNADGLEVNADTGDIVIKSGQTARSSASANRVITVRLTDRQTPAETADATLTIRFVAVPPHTSLSFNPPANANGEHVLVRAGAQTDPVEVAGIVNPGDDTLTKTGDANLELYQPIPLPGAPVAVGIAAQTNPTGQTLVAVITQTDGDTTDGERARPDLTYTVSVRYVPALEAEVRNAAGTAPLPLPGGLLEITAESAAARNIASISVSGGTSDTYDYSIENKHTGNDLILSTDGVLSIPAGVIPVAGDGLSLTVEITANDKTDSKDNGDTDAVVTTITVKYVMDPGLGGEVQKVSDSSAVTSPTVIYRLVNLAAPDEGLATGLKVVGLRGDTNAYTYANAGNTNPDGLGVDENTGVISILSGQTPDSNQSKVRLLTVKISGVRNGNPREAFVTVSVQFFGVGRFGNLQIDNNGVGDAPTNSEGEYVVVRDVSSTGQVIVINSFGISRSDSVVKSAGSPELEVFEISGGNRLRIKSGTVPGGQPPVSGGLTLVAQIKASDDDSDAQDLARPDNDNYFLTVIYLANIAPTLEDAGGTPIADLTDVDISGPTGGASLFVGNIAATGGDTGESGRYTYNKASGDLELDTTNGQVFISGKTPTAGEGEPLFIEVDVNDTGGDNSDQTDAKRIRIDVDYILDPGLSGQVQNLDGTEATSTPIIYRLAGDAVEDEGLATGLKVAGQRGDGGSTYTYAIEGTSPNPDGLSVDTSNGVISIVANQTPDTDASKVRVVTVKISGTRNSSPSEALVTVSVIFRAVNEISANNFQIQANERCGFDDLNDPTEQTLVLPAQEERTAYRLSGSGNCGFFTLVDETNGSGFGFRGGSGNIARTVLRTNGLQVNQNNLKAEIQLSSEPFEYTAERATLSIVLAYNDEGPAKDLTAEHRKTIYIVFPGIPSVNAVLNDEGGTEIPDLTDIDITVPEDNVSVYVGDIVASGGTGGTYTFEKDGTAGNLAVDTNGQVYILADAVPIAAPGTQLEMTVNVNDGGTNNDRTKAKQLTIEVDYILQLGLSGQTQQTDGTAVSGEHVVLRQADVATPSGGLDAGVKVVGQNGEGTYQYAAAGTAADSQLEVSNSGEVKIKQGQTATGQLLLLTVRITDSASTPATALHTVSIRFNSVAPHADLTRTLETGVTQNSIGEYVVVVQGAQSSNVDVLSGIKSDQGANVNRVGTDPFQLLYVYSGFTGGALRIAGGTTGEPTGQTLSFQVVATDGDGEDSDSAAVKAEKTARQDRTFDIAVRYLSHLTGAKLQDTNDADIDLSSAVLVTAAGGASVYVGDIDVSGGTGEYTFEKDGTTTGGLTVSPAGQVYLRSDAAPTSDGEAFAMTVNVNDDGKDKEVTNGETLEITVNYILEQTTTPLLGQTQDTNGAEVSGEHIVSHAANTQTPSGGLDTGVKVVGQGGTSPYTYAATADDGQLEVGSTSGEVKIKAGQTPSGQLLLLTVRISDSATPAATALQTVSIRFNSVVSLPAADSAHINLTPLSSIENRVYIATQPGTQLPSRLNHAERITVFTRNSESAAVAVFSVQYLPGSGTPGGVTEGAGSDFSIGQAAGGAKWHPVVLKAENIKRWGQVLQARFVTSDSTGYTVRVLLSEQLETSALAVGEKGIAGGNPNRPMQFNLPDGFSQTSTYPIAPDNFQTMVDFPGVTVTGLEVNNQTNLAWRGVRISTSTGGAVAVSRYGSFRWDNDRKELQRRGRPIEGGGRIVYVELWDTGTNPKIIPAILRFNASTRNVPVMAWETNPASYTGSASDTIGFEVKGGFQSRNYSPYRDMQATVDAPFEITNTRRTTPAGSRNDHRFNFEVSIPSGTPARTYNVNVKVKDRAYTASGELTQPLQVVVQ